MHSVCKSIGHSAKDCWTLCSSCAQMDIVLVHIEDNPTRLAHCEKDCLMHNAWQGLRENNPIVTSNTMMAMSWMPNGWWSVCVLQPSHTAWQFDIIHSPFRWYRLVNPPVKTPWSCKECVMSKITCACGDARSCWTGPRITLSKQILRTRGPLWTLNDPRP